MGIARDQSEMLLIITDAWYEKRVSIMQMQKILEKNGTPRDRATIYRWLTGTTDPQYSIVKTMFSQLKKEKII